MGKIEGFDEGVQMFKAIKNAYFIDKMARICYQLIDDAERKRQVDGFTGNTQPSYSWGFYIDGKLAFVISSGDRLRKPIRLKIQKGKTIYLTRPYEGKARSVSGAVDVDNLYGQQTSLNFLQSYKGSPKKGYAIVMTTGTEYSVYLENTRKLNVLTETYQGLKSILLDNLKPIS